MYIFSGIPIIIVQTQQLLPYLASRLRECIKQNNTLFQIMQVK